MFGLSPTKILFTILIIAVVWYGFKWLGRAQQAKKIKDRDAGRFRNKDSANHPDDKVEELVECQKCGDFVVADKKNGCGRDACPYER